MLVKLALTNVKKRWSDYLVLMMGLIIASGVFYTFQSLAFNSQFLQESFPTLAMITVIFQLGSFLLSLITIVYILYANSFLLAMRQKEYGMYLTLGAKKSKIGQMMFIETMVIGFLSVVAGILLGILSSSALSRLLMTQMGMGETSYQAVSSKGMISTLVFFLVMFMITGFLNISRFYKAKTLDLLYQAESVENINTKRFRTVVKTILSIILLAIGYMSLWNLKQLQLIGIFIAIITITFGTFLFFSALFPWAITKLKDSPFAMKNLRVFTLSQLSFKANSLTRVLGMVAMLLALSLGAVTTANAFYHFNDDIMAENQYDIVSQDPTPEIADEINNLPVTRQAVYHIKQDQSFYYLLADDLKKEPVTYQAGFDMTIKPKRWTDWQVGDTISFDENQQFIYRGLKELLDPYETEETTTKIFKIVSREEFENLPLSEQKHVAVKIENFRENETTLAKIDNLEKERHEKVIFNGSQYEMYQQIKVFTGGFMFMGVFLGIAFLAMLASSLMFKILSGAYADEKRYVMLHKIGVTQAALKRSIRQEIAALFAVPSILGIVHVLFGLKMFELFLPNAYSQILMPFAMFFIVYIVYYLITVKMYERIVLPTTKS